LIDSLPDSCIVETRASLPDSNESLPFADQVELIQYGRHKVRPLTRVTETPAIKGDKLLIIDDVISNQNQNQFVQSLCQVLSHHAQLNIIIIVQKLFVDTPLMKTVVSNSDNIVILKGVGSNSTLVSLQRQYFTNRKGLLTDAAQKAFRLGYRYVYIIFLLSILFSDTSTLICEVRQTNSSDLNQDFYHLNNQ
jgi:hypothetical protein